MIDFICVLSQEVFINDKFCPRILRYKFLWQSVTKYDRLIKNLPFPTVAMRLSSSIIQFSKYKCKFVLQTKPLSSYNGLFVVLSFRRFWGTIEVPFFSEITIVNLPIVHSSY